MDGGATARQRTNATAGVDRRTGNPMATGEAAGKTGVTGKTTGMSTAATGGTKAGTTTGAVTIRKCEALEEIQACFALQKEVWKFADADLIPVRMFVVAAKIGGQVIGAFVQRNNGSNDYRDGENGLIG